MSDSLFGCDCRLGQNQEQKKHFKVYLFLEIYIILIKVCVCYKLMKTTQNQPKSMQNFSYLLRQKLIVSVWLNGDKTTDESN